MSGQTIIKYGDTALPTSSAAVTLFNSATAFPPGKNFRHLGQEWFQWTIFFDGSGGTITGVVTGAYSDDGGTNWRTFYTSTTLNDDVVNEDEIYVGMFQDVRFQFTAANENATVFSCNMALNPCKSISKAASTEILGGNLGALA